jgi:hypothetical protein
VGGGHAVPHFSSPGLGQASVLSPYVVFMHPWGDVVREARPVLYTTRL